MPSLRTVALAETEWRPRSSAKTAEEMTPLVVGTTDPIIKALTSPLTPEEERPLPVKAEGERTIRLSGKDYVDAAEAVNQLFIGRRWSDGLPVVPPTEEAVKRMLSGTSRSPQEVIGQIAPAGGKAAVEKMAINTVMAGGKPEYLPVILTAMEVLADKNFDLVHLQNSLGGMTPVVVVSGPITQELNMNYDIGLFGFGWRANATIGRSIRLNLINLGHSWPGINRMAMTGSPGEFTSWCIAEHPANPWTSLTAEFGHPPTDSSVTVFGVMAKGPVMVGGAGSNVSDAESTLESLATGMKLAYEPYHFASYGLSYFLIVLGPTDAATLAKAGWTKDKLRSWLYANAQVPFSTIMVKDRLKLRDLIASGRVPKLWDVKDEKALVPLVIKPEDIWITVAGSAPGGSVVFNAIRAQRGAKVIRGATLTQAGR